MSTVTQGMSPRQPKVVYPDSDGKRMAENTLQYRWIVTIQGGLEAMFRDDPNVFVAGDLLWYAVEGDPKIRQAPDAMVVFGRPKGDRGSYKQWEEAGIAPQVVFEILSPGNRAGEMQRKLEFYQRYGVDEYYIHDPDQVTLRGYLRGPGADAFTAIKTMDGWVSPRLGIRFVLGGKELRILDPSGEPFRSFLEIVEQRDHAQRQAQQAEEAKLLAEQQARQAEEAKLLVEQQFARQAQENAKLRALLRAAGLDPDAP